ncbi:hypothetical protein ACFQNE_02550 [Gordonia phosphorivorans]|uniref:Uncharacterized protein n=1 Tax=Gordonia phosphorivorans TaxID=1056982 RepID=A0ABV6H535_9ACTN
MTGTSPARRPRRAGLFTQVPKTLSEQLNAAGCTLQESGLYFQMYTAPDTSATGYVYRRHEWAEVVGCNADSIDLYLSGLEQKELIVVSGPAILITGYMADQSFNQPKYLKSGLWDLQRSLRTKPLLRFIIGTQLLALNTAAMVGTKADSAWQAAQSLWEEITGGELPPVRHMHGNLDEPNRTMIDSLAQMPDADLIHVELDRRKWLGVHPQLREPLQRALADFSADSSVTTFRQRRTGSQ